MQDVFINYRTGDGDEAAIILERGLSERFGKERIFRATTSILPGESYRERLLNAARNSAILLAIMGPDWPHDPRLRDESDWVRREILEARSSKVRVIPVLKGRKTERLKAADLPAELAWLADIQSFRFDTRGSEADIRRIGDKLVELAPALMEVDRQASRPADPGTVHNSADGSRGTITQSRNITGDVGTVFKGNYGPIHAGKGDIHQNTQNFSGDGATYVQGDFHGGIGHKFSQRHKDRDER
jgi:hypothetical protein